MKTLNICIDIDGTITDPYYWLDFANEYFNKCITKEQVTEYYVHKVMNIEEDEYDSFYAENKFKIHSEEKIRDEVEVILKNLNVMHNIYFVTARDKELEVLTHLYLRENQIPYDELFVLGSTDKVEKAVELKCSVFIEDSYENAIQLSNAGFMVLLLDTNYNRKPLNENILRVYSWKEIALIINELFLQDKAM